MDKHMQTQISKVKGQNDNAKVKTDVKYRCYVYSIKVIKFLNGLPSKSVYWTLSDQLLRSATSVGANIVEAKSASSRRDFIKFYEIALKSANETKYWLGLLRDSTDADSLQLNILITEVAEISNILGASLLTLKKKRDF